MVRMSPVPALLALLALPAQAANHTVTVRDSFFQPAQLTIEAGDTVTWTNQANLPHNVDADDGSFTCAQGCDDMGGNGTPSAANWSFTRTFDEPGDIPYHCDVHGAPNGVGMAGTVTVEQAQEPEPEGMPINFGHTGSWFKPEQGGQGFSMEYVPATQEGEPDQFVAYWFTFAPAQAAARAKQGVEDQRWFIAQGPIDGSSATMDVFRATGGVFDDPQMTTTNTVGTATFMAMSCTEAAISYSLDLNGDGMEETTGDIDLTRLTPDVLCEDMTGSGG